MTKDDWKRRNLFSVTLMVVHSFKAGFYLMNYLKNEMKISGKDFIKFICEKSDKNKHQFIYSNLIKKVNDWNNNMLEGKGRSIFNKKYSDVYLDIEAIIFLKISENFETFYKELKDLVINLISNKNWEKEKEIIDEIFLYQDLRMPRINMRNKKLNFKYNIAEYMFNLAVDKKIKIKKSSNLIKTVNTKNYNNNYWEFTKKKIIWARKNDKIKNEIDYDNKILEDIKRAKIYKKQKLTKEYKIKMFDKVNKFKKYDSLDI